jgi:hypothetical protein
MQQCLQTLVSCCQKVVAQRSILLMLGPLGVDSVCCFCIIDIIKVGNSIILIHFDNLVLLLKHYVVSAAAVVLEMKSSRKN